MNLLTKNKKVLVLVPPTSQAKNVPRDLVYGCWCAGKRIGGIKFPPLTSVLIATILEKNKIKVDFRDLDAEKKSIKNLEKIINDYSAVITLTSTMTINEDADNLNRLKKTNPQLLIIVWGSHPTFLPEQTLSKPGIDIAVQGEADYIIRDIINKYSKELDWHNVPGISFKKNGQTVINPPYHCIENLDELPFPDRAMLKANYFNPVVKRTPYTTMFTTRGCPAQCTFCTVPYFYGKKVRLRSAHNILQELSLVVNLGYKEVFFRDEIFTFNKKRLLEVASGIINNKLDLTWICSARIGTIDEEMLRLMKKSGCHLLRVGVESGVQDILDKAQKGISIQQTKELINLASKYKLHLHAHVMLGMPGDNKQTIEHTINFLKQLNPWLVTFGICTPYPGTKLFEDVKKTHPDIKDGTSCNLEKLHQQGFFNSVFCQVSEEELGIYIKKAYRSFYLRPNYLFSRLLNIHSLNKLKQELIAGFKVISFALKGKKIPTKD